MTEEPRPDRSLEHLLRIQELDIAITQLERRKATLPERERVEEVERRRAALSARTLVLDGQRASLAGRQAELEKQIGAVTSRREAVEKRLYSARGSAARDLQAMDEEVRHLTSRRAELEEEELGVMVEMEPIDIALEEAGGERTELDTEWSSRRDELAQAEAAVDAELSEIVVSRAAAAVEVPGDLRDRYETLRARMGGIGAARLVGNRCSGCHLELPSREVDRIRRLPEGTVVTCDQCGRILVPPPASDAAPRPAR